MTLEISVKLDKKSQKQIEGVKDISKDVSNAVNTAMDSALDLILKVARENVTGGIIGGTTTPRRDGQEGLLSRSLGKRKESKGDILHGIVEIPPSSPGWIAGIVQEKGRGPIGPKVPPMVFFYGDKTTSDNPVITSFTKGIPASRWLTETFRQTRHRAEQFFSKEVKASISLYIKGSKGKI